MYPAAVINVERRVPHSLPSEVDNGQGPMTRIPTYRPGANAALQRDRQGVQRLLSIPNLDSVAAPVPEQNTPVSLSENLSETTPIQEIHGQFPQRIASSDGGVSDSAATLGTMPKVVSAASGTVEEALRQGATAHASGLSFRYLASQTTSSWRRKAIVVSLAVAVGYFLVVSRPSRDKTPSLDEVVNVSIPDDPAERLAEGPLRLGPAAASSKSDKTAASDDPIFAVPRLQPHAVPERRSPEVTRSGQARVQGLGDDRRERLPDPAIAGNEQTGLGDGRHLFFLLNGRAGRRRFLSGFRGGFLFGFGHRGVGSVGVVDSAAGGVSSAARARSGAAGSAGAVRALKARLAI